MDKKDMRADNSLRQSISRLYFTSLCEDTPALTSPMDSPVFIDVPPAAEGQRLDVVLARLLPEYSRARLQAWIREGVVLLNGSPARARDKVEAGDRVQVTPMQVTETDWTAQPIPLQPLHVDSDLIVIDKPANLVVHPGAGNPEGTLVNALLHAFPELATLPRAGIVHRLDKDTTGLMVVARSLRAHASLVEQLQTRTMGREYLALVAGEVTGGARIEAPLARHPSNRLKRAVVAGGKPAVTEYSIERRWPGLALLRCRLQTGRTHQIRVHLAHVHLPIVGDPLYSAGLRLPRGLPSELREALQGFGRQALHAFRLALTHPASGQPMRWESPLPEDFRTLLERLDQGWEVTP